MSRYGRRGHASDCGAVPRPMFWQPACDGSLGTPSSGRDGANAVPRPVSWLGGGGVSRPVSVAAQGAGR